MPFLIDFKKYRLVDLSPKLIPGEVYGPAGDKRRLEVREFSYPPGEKMHQVDMETHIGAHVEVPAHWMPARYKEHGKDLSEVPLESFIGEAVFIDMSKAKPRTLIAPEMLIENDVRPNDIVLIGNGAYSGPNLLERHAISNEAAKWMAERPIKMLGVDNSVLPESFEAIKNPKLESYATHDYLLKNDILLIEGLSNLGSLRKKRFFFIGFPPKIAKLDAFPIRAVAIEEI